MGLVILKIEGINYPLMNTLLLIPQMLLLIRSGWTINNWIKNYDQCALLLINTVPCQKITITEKKGIMKKRFLMHHLYKKLMLYKN